jgi:hypothetical protein
MKKRKNFKISSYLMVAGILSIESFNITQNELPVLLKHSYING